MKIYAHPKVKNYLIKEEGDIFTLLSIDGESDRYWGSTGDLSPVQYPPHWPHAFKYRWEPLSKLFAPEGFVCIGKGDNDFHLYKFFGGKDNVYDYCPEEKRVSRTWNGSLEYKDYYVKKETWNETFKEFLTKEKEMNKIYTRADSAARELVKKLAKSRGFHWSVDSDSEAWTIWTLGNETAPDLCLSNYDFDWWKKYKEVPLHEFIYQLGQIPEKVKEKEINILPWKVVIRGEKCDIGCKKDVSVESLKTFIKNLPSYFGTMDMLGKRLSFGKDGFQVEGETISWETLAEFKKELEK